MNLSSRTDLRTKHLNGFVGSRDPRGELLTEKYRAVVSEDSRQLPNHHPANGLRARIENVEIPSSVLN